MHRIEVPVRNFRRNVFFRLCHAHKRNSHLRQNHLSRMGSIVQRDTDQRIAVHLRLARIARVATNGFAGTAPNTPLPVTGCSGTYGPVHVERSAPAYSTQWRNTRGIRLPRSIHP